MGYSSTNFSGKIGAERKTHMAQLALPPPLDMAQMDDMEDLGFLDGGLVDPEMLRSSMKSAGGGALSAVLFTLAVNKIRHAKKDAGGNDIKVTDPYDPTQQVNPPLLDSPLKRSLAAVGLLLVGGRAIWGSGNSEGRRDFAKGFMGALGGQLGVEIVTAALTKKQPTTTTSGMDGFNGLAQLLPEERALLAQVEVQENRHHYLNGDDGDELAQVDMDERRPGAMADIGAWIS